MSIFVKVRNVSEKEVFHSLVGTERYAEGEKPVQARPTHTSRNAPLSAKWENKVLVQWFSTQQVEYR